MRQITDKCEEVGQKGRRARHNQHSLVCEEPAVVVIGTKVAENTGKLLIGSTG